MRHSTKRAQVTWLELEADGEYEQAIEVARQIGVGRLYETLSANQLMSLVRAARLANRPTVARDGLLACRRRFAGTEEAARATFLLGRTSTGADAIRWFEQYLQDAPAGLLAREARGRLVQGYEAAGRSADARREAATYLRLYPQGPHAKYASGVLAQ